MRKTILIASAVVLGSMMARAADTSGTSSDVSGVSCFVNLSTPEYPKAALQGHIDGSVWTWTDVSPEGVPGKIETQVVSAWSQADKLLVPAVEKAIHASLVKPQCAGQKVWVVFRYQLHGDAIDHPQVTTRVEAPNILWIESQPSTAPTQTGTSATKH